jgi:intracellular septation protein A
LLTRNLAFIKFKPSIIYFALGAGMLRPGWMTRYAPTEILGEMGENVLVGWGYAWAALMILIALANLALALRGSTAAWAWFASVGANLAQVGFGAVQYLVIRNHVKALRAARSVSAV